MSDKPNQAAETSSGSSLITRRSSLRLSDQPDQAAQPSSGSSLVTCHSSLPFGRSSLRLLAQRVTHSPEETVSFGRELAVELQTPGLVLLEGELGSGKTTLVKGILASLASIPEDEVTSPSFTLVHEYGPQAGFITWTFTASRERATWPRSGWMNWKARTPPSSLSGARSWWVRFRAPACGFAWNTWGVMNVESRSSGWSNGRLTMDD